MLDKLDLSDSARFAVSAGIALIGLAALLGWLILTQSFDLLVPATTIPTLTPDAQLVITERLALLRHLVAIGPWILLCLLGVGLLLVMEGLRRWRPFEDLNMRRQRLEIALLEAKLGTTSVNDDLDRARADLPPTTSAKPSVLSPVAGAAPGALVEDDPGDPAIQSLLATEQKVLALLEVHAPPRKHLLAKRRVGQYQIDAVLVSDDQEDPDVIIEIKDYRGALSVDRVREAATRILLASESFSQTFARRAVPMLILIVDDPEYARLANSLQGQDLREHLGVTNRRLLLRLMPRSALANLSERTIRSLLDLRFGALLASV